MNDRIRELAEQAGIAVWGDAVYMYHPDNTLDSTVMTKFAELIVKECADLFMDQKYMILNPHEPFANERVRALKEHDKDTVKTIKRHFGVK